MSFEPDPESTRRASAYNQVRNSSYSPQAERRYHPAGPPPLQQPPTAYVSPTLRTPTTPRQKDPLRLQTSISSAESGSTIGAESKPYLAYQQYQYGPMAERGLVEETITRHSPSGSQHSGRGARRSIQAGTPVIEDNSAVFRYIQEKSITADEETEGDHALWILMWMSFLDPFHCLFSALFSIFAVLIITVFAPLRLCRKECSPSISLVRMIAPVFRNHLQMIFAKSLDNAHTFEFSPVCLVLVHVTSPLISIGNAIAAWIMAVFWVFAIIMGNPDGTERRDDGRASVLLLRDWWEKYLLFAIRK
ncbi:uncharacterized protein Z519_06287 [Cladophialophora bantiana CBS 173.52]|uniref:Uncharacterized protein n=1 Tax=Cladophialophora bantiana (strain ATCC 10958 / CBS 173.52 / CDC B-1940 / NIH 8579) TaxID=1442370 RepID=A0A0D2G4X4_CLAB1|nr:uncharacterized protein Z519_06287 [Cladophialophora bantiana CBS 173.52]KIW93682.1 hypothetical protein Z519_06287 [Cladophialophora bantiana CBS 173.52]